MPRRMIYNPADGQYVYVDDEDPNAQATPGVDLTNAMARYTGSSGSADTSQSGIPTIPMNTVPQNADPGRSYALDNNVAPNPTAQQNQGMDQFGDYDPNYEAARSNALASQNQAETDYSSQLQNLGLAFAPQFTGLEQQHTDDLDYLQNVMANQGILRSSNNLTAQGRINNQYQNQKGALTTQQQMNEQSLAQQRLSSLAAAQQGLTTAEGSHAQFLSDRAQQRAAQQAATEAAQNALRQQQQQQQQQSPGFTTTPTGQITQAPAIQYATAQNPVGLVAPGSPLDYNQQPQAPAGPYDSPYSNLWAQQQGQPTSGYSEPPGYQYQPTLESAGGDPDLYAAMMRRLGLM